LVTIQISIGQGETLRLAVFRTGVFDESRPIWRMVKNEP